MVSAIISMFTILPQSNDVMCVNTSNFLHCDWPTQSFVDDFCTKLKLKPGSAFAGQLKYIE